LFSWTHLATILMEVEPLQIVPESDDPSLPALTFRVFVLGSILCVFGGELPSSLSTLFADPHLNSCHFSAILLQIQCSVLQQLLHHPHGISSQVPSPSPPSFKLIVSTVGHWMAALLPDHEYSFFNNRLRFTLNPGPFNKKEVSPSRRVVYSI
jgi:hypothetical protein